MAALYLPTRLVGRVRHRLSRQTQEAQADMVAFLHERLNIGGMLLSQLFGQTQADARVTLQGEPIKLRSDGTFLRDYLHVDDVVAGYLALVDVAGKTPGVAYNFSDESPSTVLAIYEACCVAAGVPGLEPRILDQAVGEIRDQYLDASRARADLDWRAEVTLADGLARTFPWYEGLLGRAR